MQDNNSNDVVINLTFHGVTEKFVQQTEEFTIDLKTYIHQTIMENLKNRQGYDNCKLTISVVCPSCNETLIDTTPPDFSEEVILKIKIVK